MPKTVIIDGVEYAPVTESFWTDELVSECHEFINGDTAGVLTPVGVMANIKHFKASKTPFQIKSFGFLNPHNHFPPITTPDHSQNVYVDSTKGKERVVVGLFTYPIQQGAAHSIYQFEINANITEENFKQIKQAVEAVINKHG